MDDEQEQLSTEEQAPLAEPEAQLSEEGAAPEGTGEATPEEGAAPQTFTAEQVEEAKKEARAEVQRVKDPEVEAAKQEAARLQAQMQEYNLRAQETKQRQEWEAAGISEAEITDFQQKQRAVVQQQASMAALQSKAEPELKEMVAVRMARQYGLSDHTRLLDAEDPHKMELEAVKLSYEAKLAASAKVERAPQDFQRAGATPAGKSNSRTEIQSRYIKGEISWDDYEDAKRKS